EGIERFEFLYLSVLESEPGGVARAAIAARQNLLDRRGARLEQRAHAPRLLPSSVGKVALGGAIVDIEIRRFACPRSIGMVDQDDLSAVSQQSPPGLGGAGRCSQRHHDEGQEKS